MVHVVQVLTVSSADDVLWMSVVRGIRGVGGIYEMCMRLARGGVGGEGGGRVNERIGFGIYQSCGKRGSVGRVSVFLLRWCGLFRWGKGGGLVSGSGEVGWCDVCVSCESLFSV